MSKGSLFAGAMEKIGGRPGDLIFNAGLLFLILCAFFCPLSIGAAQLFGALAFIAWILGRPWQRWGQEESLPFRLPLVLFILLSAAAVCFSINPIASLWYSRRLLLFLAIPVAVAYVNSRERIRSVLAALTLGALITTSWGTVQVILGTAGGESGRRLKGFLGHYMTAGGELMIIALLLIAVVIFSRKKSERIAFGSALIVILVGLVLTQTRNVYVGLAAGCVVLILVWRPALLALLPFVLSLAVLLCPPFLRERIFSIADLDDASVQRRIVMCGVGMAIVADYPLFGTGPQQLVQIYDRYKPSPADPHEVHLHNNPLQLAAERGIAAALIWIWLLAALGIGHARIKSMPNAPPHVKAASAGAFSVIVAVFTAGLFEYNFGDSEILMLFLLAMAVPYGYWRLSSRQSDAS